MSDRDNELKRWRRLEPMLEPLRFLLGSIYPEDVFNGETGDPGVVAVTRIRQGLRAFDLDETTLDLFGEQLDAARYLMDTTRSHLEAALIEHEEGSGDLIHEVRQAIERLDWSANPEHVVLYETELGRLRHDKMTLIVANRERVDFLQRSRRRWIEALKASIPDGWNAVEDAEKAVREVVERLRGLKRLVSNSFEWLELCLAASSAIEPTTLTRQESVLLSKWLDQLRDSLEATTKMQERLGLPVDTDQGQTVCPGGDSVDGA